MNERVRGVAPVRRGTNPSQAVKSSSSTTRTTTAPLSTRTQPRPGILKASTTSTSASTSSMARNTKFNRGASSGVNRFAAASKGVEALFDSLDLNSDEVDKENSSRVPEAILKQARKSGQLNLSGRGLTSVPMAVWRLLEPKQQPKLKIGFSTDRIEEDESWWENVDLTKLILASNQISQIPSEIQNLRFLTVLDLHDNCLEGLPEEIGQLENLLKINLNHNRISQLPEGFFELRNLRTLTACHNGIVELTDDIGRLDQLEHLDLAHNNLRVLPRGFGYLTRVSRLDLSHNKLLALPSQIGALRHLIFLDASNNGLTDLEDTLEDMARLEQLYLHHNQIKFMPRLRNCPNLKELHLGYNRIEELIDDDIENVPALKLLDMRDNKIKVIPDSLINLQTLERLDVSNNDLSGLPPSLGTMPHLKSLSVDGNPMKTIRRDILQRGTTELMKFLRSRIDEAELVRLRETGNVSPTAVAATLGSSPPVPDKFTMRTAQMMSMSKKDIAAVPQEAVDNAIEARVTGVDLSKNRFIKFPVELESLLPLISQLDISFNRLESIPPLIGFATNLKYLNLSNNKLLQLPDALSELPQLREICISSNRFDSLPSSIYNVANLEILVASSNQISFIDVDELSKLTRLTVLDLQNNNIDHVPPHLGLLKQIRALQLEGNPFRVPRAQILVKGTESIMSWLRDRIPKDE